MKMRVNFNLLFIFMTILPCFTNAYGVPSEIPLSYTRFKNYAYVQTDYVNPQAVYTIEYPETVVTAGVRPFNKHVKTAVKNRKVSFNLPEAGNYVVYINELKIALFAEKPEALPSVSRRVNICTDLSVNNTGTVNETAKIQKAIIDIAGSGKVLFFPKGIYLTGQLRIVDKMDVRIYLERGAVILADTNAYTSYATDDVFGRPQPSSIAGKKTWTPSASFIFIDNSKEVSIKGYGMINGQGRAARRNAVIKTGSESKARYRNFLITRSGNVSLEGIISADPGVWNTHILGSEDVSCVDVKLLNELQYAPTKENLDRIMHDNINTDGFDIDASSRVLIKNCFGYCADDNIAVKTSEYCGLLGDLDGVTVENCVFLTQKSSLKVGTETGGKEMKNIVFKNNDVLESDRAISVYCYDGASIQVVYDNNRIEYNCPDTKQALVHIEVKPRVEGVSPVGKALVEINNTTALTRFPKKSVIAYRSGTQASDLKVSFKNFAVEGKKILSADNDIFRYEGAPAVSFE